MALATLLSNNGVDAFAPISARATAGISKTAIALSTVAAPNGAVNGGVDSSSVPKAWDCDEEANCVEVDACDEEQCRTTLDVRIHNEWYDLSGELYQCQPGTCT